ncbi:MAG: LD-carboxypeptidase [Paramuribaculum sp.]|nr:LD-carboxypeptidase [Paramuribaculum sp.]
MSIISLLAALTVGLTLPTEGRIIVPDSLHQGDKVMIVTPSSGTDASTIDHAVDRLRLDGYNPVVAPHAYDRRGSYGGSDIARFEDLREAILDPEVKAIFCARGGYGAVHLLEALDTLPIAENPKWIIGFSDISALHALWNKHSVASVHGPMCAPIGRENRGPDVDTMMKMLRGAPLDYTFDSHPLNRSGSVKAPLTGGNLAVLDGLISTPFDIISPGAVLFIEDIAEPVYKIERQLYRLKLSGTLANLSGLIVGHFTDYRSDEDFSSMERMIADMVAEYDYPVAFGIPVGHASPNMPLVEGVDVSFQVAGDGTVHIYQNPYAPTP